MLFAKPTIKGTGIELFGDIHDLNSLHQTIHDLTGHAVVESDEFVLGLAYEIRKASDGFRDVNILGHADEKTTYYSFKSLWPIFLMQVGMLRWLASFKPTDREIQSNLFRLEFCTEKALVDFDREIGAECTDWLYRFFHYPDEPSLLDFVESRAFYYSTQTPPGKPRFRKLPDILRSFFFLDPQYMSFANEFKASDEGVPYLSDEFIQW